VPKPFSRANCWRKFAISCNNSGHNCFGARVRFWHKADITSVLNHVRFGGQSGHSAATAYCPLMTQSGHHNLQVAPMLAGLVKMLGN
jgi:hypothetical protein